jgi:hypothetical protein
LINLNKLLSYENGGRYIRLLVSCGGKLLTEGQFTLEHNISKEPPLKNLTLIEGATLYTALVAEVLENHFKESSGYPFTREQFIAMVNLHIQHDPFELNESIETTLTKEFTNYGFDKKSQKPQ